MAPPTRGRRTPGARSKPWRSLTLILLAIVALTAGMFGSGHTAPRLGIDLAGGTSITLQAKNQPGHSDAINPTNMQTAKNIINQRVNGLGVSEAEVQTQGDRHIIANIPRGVDEKQARQQVGTTAKLSFRPVLTLAPTGKQAQKQQQQQQQQQQVPTKPGGESGKQSGDEAGKKGQQGRAVTDGLRAKSAADAPSKDDPKSGGKSGDEKPKKPSPPPSPPQQSQQPQPPGVSSALAKKLQKLDCNGKKDKAQAGAVAARAKDSDPVVACDQHEKIKYALGPVAVRGKDVSNAKSTFNQMDSRWIVQMGFNSKGSSDFGKVTGELKKKQQPQNQFAIELDGKVVSAPSVKQRLTSNAEISGDFTQGSSEQLANILSYGALPLTFEESDVTTVTPALGSDQLDAGLIAGAIGLGVVIIYLVTYYRGLSFIAIASLLVSTILTYTIMSLLGPTIGFALNLPAVCGAIVAIGITADSFIVYFERLRDEVREGRTLRPAVERAWPRARRTVLVADFVSFLAAAVLFTFTVGKVQGFAFTLGLTTLLDVVVVFFFTKPLVTLLARRKFFSSGHPWSGLDPRRLGAKPPLRRGRRSSAASTDPKEA